MAGGFGGASGELRREYVFLTLINYGRSGFCRYMQGADVAVRGCGLVGDRARVRVSMLRDGLRVRREYVFEGRGMRGRSYVREAGKICGVRFLMRKFVRYLVVWKSLLIFGCVWAGCFDCFENQIIY